VGILSLWATVQLVQSSSIRDAHVSVVLWQSRGWDDTDRRRVMGVEVRPTQGEISKREMAAISSVF